MDRFNWVTQDCFNAIAQLSRLVPHDAVQPELVHNRMRGFVDAQLRRAREAGYSEADGQLIAYAVVALCDETMMSKTGPIQQFWSQHLLQLVYFNENTAGENFFVRLEEARRDSQRNDVLRAFYLALMLGFRGRYGAPGGDVSLVDLTDSVRTQLFRVLTMPEILAPNGQPPEEGLLQAGRRLPLLALALGVLSLSAVLYLGLAVSLRESVHRFVVWMSDTGSR